MSPLCQGSTRTGERCNVSVSPGVTHCYNHDPTRAEERRRNASRAGKSRPARRGRLSAPPRARAVSPADICLDGNHAKADHLPLVELVSVLDEAEALLREDLPAEGC
jgi:hypothetical protein